MSNVRPASDEIRNDNDREGHEQFPVNTLVTKVYFDSNVSGGDLVRIVVMSGNSTSACAANHEYHYGNTGISIDDVTSFTMRTGTLASTQQAIDGFVDAMTLHVETAQAPSWSSGVYTPTAAHKRLFKAVDPDDSTKMIGALIEQDAQGRLHKLTWYKTQEARALFATTPTALPFAIVRDEAGAPSLDPSDIAGWTWYYTTTIALGS